MLVEVRAQVSSLTSAAAIEFHRCSEAPTMIVANEFFREVTLRLCIHLEIEEGIQTKKQLP